jgi:hypothetical protein
MLNGGVWEASIEGRNEHEKILAMGTYDPKKISPTNKINPQKGDPLLLVYALNTQENNEVSATEIKVSTEKGPLDKQGKEQYYNRIAVASTKKQVHYKVLLVPFRYGDAMPDIQFEKNHLTISWKDGQKDQLNFSDDKGRQKIVVTRNGRDIVDSQ